MKEVKERIRDILGISCDKRFASSLTWNAIPS